MPSLLNVLPPLVVAALVVMDCAAAAAAGRRLERAPQFGPALGDRPPTCQLSRIVYNSGEMIERTNPCDFCFCYKGEVLCWKKQCPPPPPGNCQPKFVDSECCPRYMCERLHIRHNFI